MSGVSLGRIGHFQLHHVLGCVADREFRAQRAPDNPGDSAVRHHERNVVANILRRAVVDKVILQFSGSRHAQRRKPIAGLPRTDTNHFAEYIRIEDLARRRAICGPRFRWRTVECPRHGSLFDLRTGKPKTLPAFQPVRTFPVEIIDDKITLEV